MDALTALIHEDATQSMPPFDLWLAGRDDILTWWFGPGNGCRGSRVIPVESANGAPAFGQYKPADERGGLRAVGAAGLEIENGRIVELTFFLDVVAAVPALRAPARAATTSLAERRSIRPISSTSSSNGSDAFAALDPQPRRQARQLQACESVDRDGVGIDAGDVADDGLAALA